MDWLSSWFKEKRTLIHTTIAILIAFILLVSQGKVVSFICNATDTIVYYPFKQIRSSLSILSSKNETVDALNAKLADLTVRLQTYNETLEENKRLRALLGFVPPESFKIVPAEIIGVSGEGIPNSVLINLGVKDSIQINQTVINQSGLAGRVGKVMDDYSVVYLLTEPRCRVAARIKSSREQGIIRYKMSRGMYLDNCPQQAEMALGDTVITSGLGGIFPEGIVVGTIEKIDAPEKEFFYDISIKPAVNFNGLDELYILAREK